MAIDLTGIQNVNEFYSHHYLDALLDKDIKDLLSKWDEAEKEKNQKPPYKKLSSCAEAFFNTKAAVDKATSLKDRFEETHPLNVALAEALGYEYQSNAYEFIDDSRIVPVLASLKRDGNPYLWILEAPFTNADEDQALLDLYLLPNQMPNLDDDEPYEMPMEENWENLLSLIFRKDEPPRWILLLAGNLIYLVERHKWGQGKYILFDVDEILGRKQNDILKATAALISRDSLCPDEGSVLHDTLDENSHKHAFAVSTDLKYGIRKAVELLGNEYIYYQRNVSRKSIYQDDELAHKLTQECLTYLYRLLFLFYAEARGGELDVVPMKSEEYRLGYSLESLRDLELNNLTTSEAQNGYFFDQSLKRLFNLINNGYKPNKSDARFDVFHEVETDSDLLFDPIFELPLSEDTGKQKVEEKEVYLNYGFEINGLESPLFDLKRTPLLSSVKLRNSVLQEVIQLLSLSREGGRGNRRRERGRISYAELGINQLGAVYEGLLSYTGFFAKDEALYEVKPAGSLSTDETQQSFFVPESEIGKYEEDELVYKDVEDGEPGERRRKRYERGSFIFRLAGRDREKSASYYTPECLTQCVVKYSLKELLKDITADDIMKITVCEPAMGSAAFINEAINQLADAYLERKQKELDKRIPPSEYLYEKQKVKAFLATHNCYGVDLNPTAVELAKVSLWLNTIYKDSKCPWFGLRLACGNSLIGARRQVYDAKVVQRKGSKDKPNWLGIVPEKLALGPEWQKRPKDTIYHFLLPAEGMAEFDNDKVIKELLPNEVKVIKEWRKDFINKPFDKQDAKKLVELSDAIDHLWKQVIRERQDAEKKCKQPFNVWGQQTPQEQNKNIEAQEKVAAELERPYTAYRRLKLVMDYWCALWFWPLQKVDQLPTRDSFLMELELIIQGTVTAKQDKDVLFEYSEGTEISSEHQQFVHDYGWVNVDELCKKVTRLKTVTEVSKEIHFHHWELKFAELFSENGGFDLIVGNPPWVLLSFDESGVIADKDPLIKLRSLSATRVAMLRGQIFQNAVTHNAYLNEFTAQAGSKNYIGNIANYPLLQGMKANLYKCFISIGWAIGSKNGTLGLLHPEGVYDDPQGNILREDIYKRLKVHCQFVNEYPMFNEVSNHAKFSVNVYMNKSENLIEFLHISNIFHPITINESFIHDGNGNIPGIKNEKNNWDLRPHKNRLVHIQKDRLKVFSALYDKPGTPPLQARLPVIHSEEIVAVLEKFTDQKVKLGDLQDSFFSTQHWNETNAQNDGTIKRETRYPEDISEWIVSGPHFFVGTPLYQTPNDGCSTNRDYSKIDLTAIPEDYLPRTNYVPACSPDVYLERTPKWNGEPVTDFYRLVFRAILSPTGERTLIGSVIPPGVSHIHTVKSFVFTDTANLLLFTSVSISIVVDFLVKVFGRSNIYESPGYIPLPTESIYKPLLINRVLRLNCINKYYDTLWKNCDQEILQADIITKSDHRLFHNTSSLQINSFYYQSDFARRQALVEIDALSALALGLTEEELITIYQVQFPVLQQYERENLYDQTGRLVPNQVLKIAEQNGVDIREPLNISIINGRSDVVGEVETPGLGITGGIKWEDPKMEPRMVRVYAPPFTKCDRVEDMRQAYRVFQERIKEQEKQLCYQV